MSAIQVSYYATNTTMESREEIIRFQLLLHCHLAGVTFSDKGRKTINDTELDCLTLIGLTGECELNALCTQLANMEWFKSSQSARNTLSSFAEKGLLVKKGTSRKKVMLNPDLRIQTTGNIMIDVKSLYRDIVREKANESVLIN